MTDGFTAFEETGRHVGRMMARAELDRESLNLPLKPCDLGECGGTCCHDGVRLNDEEASLLRRLTIEHQDWLQAAGVTGDGAGDWLVTEGEEGPRTATRPNPMSRTVSDYPSHFPDTSCVFLIGGARCALQMLSVHLGKHSWFYKPLTCWLHPLAIESPDGRPILRLHTPETDPQRKDGYDGFNCRTHCGRIREEGVAGWEVLREEIRGLSALSGRSLEEELLI